MFEVNNGIAKIDGSRGKYNEENVKNPSVRYGRNSVQNFYSYMTQPIMNDNNATPPILDFGFTPDATDKNIKAMEKYTQENDAYLKSLPPLEYEYRYMPNIQKKGDIDKDALLGAAYEELGGRTEINVIELDAKLAMTSEHSFEALDLNKDGKIDLGEYSTSILASDMLSNDDCKIDGVINNKGNNLVQEFTKKSNAKAATQWYGTLYNQYNLNEASKNFNPEN